MKSNAGARLCALLASRESSELSLYGDGRSRARQPRRAASMAATSILRIGIIANGQEFVANISNGAMHLEPGGTRDCDAAIEGDPNDIASVIYAGRSLEEAVSSGALRIDGTKAVLKKFLQYFPLPERAPDLVA